MSRRRVFVFGAGASKHAGGPLMQELFERGFFYLCNADIYRVTQVSFWKVAEFLDELGYIGIVKQLKEDIGNNLNAPSHPWRLAAISIEEVLATLESDRFGDRGEEYRSALHDFIFEALQISTTRGDHYSLNPDGSTSHWRTLYDRLVDYGVDLADDNCFVTFNYDLLLDKAVAINDRQLLGDYHVPFDSIQNFPGYEEILNGSRLGPVVDVLKLHGSLNWSECRACGHLRLAFYVRYGRIRSQECPACGQAMSPVLVAPTLTKDVAGGCLGVPWRIVDEKLAHADELVIVTYSFPSEDRDAWTRFQHALRRNKRAPRLVLVEPNFCVRARVEEILGMAVLTGAFDSFEQYAAASGFGEVEEAK